MKGPRTLLPALVLFVVILLVVGSSILLPGSSVTTQVSQEDTSNTSEIGSPSSSIESESENTNRNEADRPATPTVSSESATFSASNNPNNAFFVGLAVGFFLNLLLVLIVVLLRRSRNRATKLEKELAYQQQQRDAMRITLLRRMDGLLHRFDDTAEAATVMRQNAEAALLTRGSEPDS